MPTEPMFHQDIDTYPLPPPPKRTFLPEPEWGTSSSAHTPMFNAGEIKATHEAWVNILKGVMPNLSETQLSNMAMDRAISELQVGRAETIQAIN